MTDPNSASTSSSSSSSAATATASAAVSVSASPPPSPSIPPLRPLSTSTNANNNSNSDGKANDSHSRNVNTNNNDSNGSSGGISPSQSQSSGLHCVNSYNYHSANVSHSSSTNSISSLGSSNGSSSTNGSIRLKTLGRLGLLRRRVSVDSTMSSIITTASTDSSSQSIGDRAHDIDSFARFLRNDRNRMHQRRLLWNIHRNNSDVGKSANNNNANDNEGREATTSSLSSSSSAPPTKLTRRQSEILTAFSASRENHMKPKKDALKEFDSFRRRKSSLSTLDKFNSLFKLRKAKKRSFLETLHLFKLAIRDNRPDLAYAFAARFPTNNNSKIHAALSRAFVMAMVARLEDVVILLVHKNYPGDVNAPAVTVKMEVDQVGSEFNCPSYFTIAISFGLERVVAEMIRCGASMNQTWYSLSPLMQAVTYLGRGHTRLVNLFLECGANPLQGIPYMQYYQMLKFKNMVPHEALANPSNSRPASAVYQISSFKVVPPNPQKVTVQILDAAAGCGNFTIVVLLLSKLSKENISASKLCLLSTQDVDIATLLLDCGADVTQKDYKGNNALHIAAKTGNYPLIPILIHFGIFVDSLNANENTPLSEALLSKQFACARLLIKHGANVNAASLSGETPQSIAKKCRELGDTEEAQQKFFDIKIPSDYDEGEINVDVTINRCRETKAQILKNYSNPTIMVRRHSIVVDVEVDMKRVPPSPAVVTPGGTTLPKASLLRSSSRLSFMGSIRTKGLGKHNEENPSPATDSPTLSSSFNETAV